MAGLVIAAALLSACTPAPEPTPTASPAFASEEEAFAAAEETYRAYIAAFNAVDLSNPKTFDPVFELAAGDYEKQERRDLSVMHAEGYQRGGEIRILRFEGSSADETSIRARTCNDISTTTFTDAEGVSLIPPTRPDVVALELIFSLDHGLPLLTSAEPIQDKACFAG